MISSLAREPVAKPTVTHEFRSILFVGNSWTHGHYNPVRTYNGSALTHTFTSATEIPEGPISNRHAIDLNATVPAGDPRSEYNKPVQAGPWGGIPGIIQHFADTLRLNWQTYIMAMSGRSLPAHVLHATRILSHGSFTDVVAQDRLDAGINGNLYPDVQALHNVVLSRDASTQIYLYAPPLPPDMQKFDEVQVERGFSQVASQLELGAQHIAEVGYAFRLAQAIGVATRTYPHLLRVPQHDQHLLRTGDAPDPNHAADGKIQLYGQDLHHPSSAGAYLSALIQFATLSHLDPRTIGTRDASARELGLSDRDSTQLQDVAAQALWQKGFILRRAAS